MSFGMYLFAFFCPPVYFACRRRWIASIIHGCLYMLALALVISLIGALFGVILWLLEVAHAMWDLKAIITENAIQHQAEVLAQQLRK